MVLWPESGIPDYLRDGYPQRYYTQMTAGGDPAFARTRIGRVIGEDSLLLTGVVDLEIEMVEGREKAVAAYNAITSIDPDGRLGERYAKAHLVPYGEYLPLRSWLEPLGLSRLVAGTLDFIPGPGPLSYDLGAYGKAGMQICYEIVFSGEVADRSNRPDYIFNPSNDGWFGTWGPPQHLAQARMRAAEEGLPVLRSTTTGISAVIDARGVVRDISAGTRRPHRHHRPSAARTELVRACRAQRHSSGVSHCLHYRWLPCAAGGYPAEHIKISLYRDLLLHAHQLSVPSGVSEAIPTRFPTRFRMRSSI